MKAFLKSAFFGALLVLSACAKDGGGGNSDTAVVPAPTCNGVAGQIQTMYGCMPTAGCGVNQGMYNGTCIAGYQNGGYPNGGAYPNGGYGGCVAGQIYTMYGCAPTAGCGANQGMYNGTCVAGYQNGGYPNAYPNGYQGGGYYYYNGGYVPGMPYYYRQPAYGYGGGAGFYIGGRVGFGY